MGLLGAGRAILNRAIRPLGVEVCVVRGARRQKWIDSSVYAEAARPEVPLYVNIGAGGFYHPVWHNLDRSNEYYRSAQVGNVHIEHDLTSGRPLPLKSGSIKVAYTSHVIEHVRDQHVAQLFAEVHRCLLPGGYFRVTCPDMDLEYAAYARGDIGFWKWPNAFGVYNTSVGQRFLDHFATALTESYPGDGPRLSDREVTSIFDSYPKHEAFDRIIDMIPESPPGENFGNHINWFSSEKIMRMLHEAGFSNVYESRYGQSCCPALRDTQLFDTTCPELSVYVECRK